MIRMHCRANHRTSGTLCPECEGLLDYARKHLNRCPYQGDKTTCAKCPTHCFKPEMREKIRQVMRYAGPRMIYRHPIMALLHLLDERRKKPLKESDR